MASEYQQKVESTNHRPHSGFSERLLHVGVVYEQGLHLSIKAFFTFAISKNSVSLFVIAHVLYMFKYRLSELCFQEALCSSKFLRKMSTDNYLHFFSRIRVSCDLSLLCLLTSAGSHCGLIALGCLEETVISRFDF